MTPNPLPIQTEAYRAEQRQRQSRRQFLLVFLFLLALWGGLRGARWMREREVNEFARLLSGTWELETMAGKSVGNAPNNDILFQKVTFQNGVLHGETRIRADSAAGTTAMPFADTTIRQYSESADGKMLTFLWNGTYTVQKGWQVTLQLNKTLFTVGAKWDAKQKRLTLDHDFALTYEGTFLYRQENSPQKPVPPLRHS